MKDLINDLITWVKGIEPLAENNKDLKRELSDISRRVKTYIRGDIEIEGDHNRINIGDSVSINLSFPSSNEGDDRIIERYQQALVTHTEELPWWHIDPGFACQYGGDRAVLLQNVYVAANARPLRERYQLEARHLDEVSDREPQPLDTVIQRPENRLMVLKGLAGSGKTTFVNHLVWQRGMDPQALPEQWRELPVIRLRLRHLQQDLGSRAENPIWQGVRADLHFDSRTEEGRDRYLYAIQDCLKRRGGIVLLDGLDELPGGQVERERFLSVVDKFTKHDLHPEHGRLLLTTRPHAFNESTAGGILTLPDFSVAKLAPLSAEQQNEFLQNWSRALGRRKGWIEPQCQKWRINIIRELDSHPYLRELAQRPLWLTLIATLQAHRGRLPEDRIVLFDELIELMLHRWQSWRIETGEGIDEQVIKRFLNASEFRSALEAMAYDLHRRGDQGQGEEAESLYLPWKELIGILAKELDGVQGINSSEYLVYLSEGAALLEVDESGRYGFFITSFQEFLAAGHLAEQDDLKQRLTRHLGENPVHWREVAEYLPGIIHLRYPRFGALAVFNHLVPEAPPGAGDTKAFSQIPETTWRLVLHCARALLDLRLDDEKHQPLHDRLSAVRERLGQWLLRWVEGGFLPAQERAEAGDVLGHLGDPRFHGPERMCLPRLYRGEEEPTLGFVKAPGGEFWMGSNKGDDPDAADYEMVEGKAHRVDCVEQDYWVARYPVTVAQFGVFMEEEGYEDASWWSEQGLAWKTGEWDSALKEEDFGSRDIFKFYQDLLARRGVELRHQPMDWENQRGFFTRPVTGVCWFEAQAYCNWLNARIRTLDEVEWIKADYRVRLPTEAEWEKAVRAGDLRRYPWGNDEWSAHRANAEGKIGRPSTVGMYPEGINSLDIHDLSGNVWEWTRSVYGVYPYNAAEAEKASPQSGDTLVFRGGSWVGDARHARCAARGGNLPDLCNYDLGFRVVLSLAADP
jgi:formylglycine-generating enzyme required for sulfatase activity